MSQHTAPNTGLKGFIENWRFDIVAAVSVALVAMPLALGIAVASGAPPMSGVLSAVIGGLVTTFIRGSHIAINGPANALIAVILAAVVGLDSGEGGIKTFQYVLAAIVISGGLQTLLGIFRLGRIAEMFPSSVIHGILATIGIIIVAKQLHVAMDTVSDGRNAIAMLIDAFKKIPEANPFVGIISILGLLLLVFHSRISYKLFHFLPAPIWVLLISIPFVFLFDFKSEHSIALFGKVYEVGPRLLVPMPDNALDSIIHPDFSKINTGRFWLAVISITLIGTVETLTSTKAVDKLDPYKRKTNLNKDLIGVGLSTMLSGALGGLPIVTVIIRSTVNVHNNAKTKWSKFFHGLILLVFVLLLSPVIKVVPLAALAVILVFSGFKLAAPRVFTHAYEQGLEQLLFLIGTMVITIFSSLLWGILGGIVITLGVHILLSRVPVQVFFKMVFNPGTRLVEKSDGNYELKVKGVANFLYILRLNKLLERVPEGAMLKINISTARLIDLTVLEHIEDFKRSHKLTGGDVNIVGVEHHVASTVHPLALKSQTSPMPTRLSQRQQSMKNIAAENGWTFRAEIDWNTYYLQNFQFFESRPVEYKTNVMNGTFNEGTISWELCDLTFDEGAFIATQVYHTTAQYVKLPYRIPKFILEAEVLFDKIFDKVVPIHGSRDIDFSTHKKFSNNLLLKGEDEAAVRSFFTDELINFIEDQEIYHVESNGEALLIFKNLRIANINDLESMLEFSEQLTKRIKIKSQQPELIKAEN